MPEEASNSEAEEQSQGLDLSSLGGLSLGPQWGSGSIPPSKTPKTRGGPREDRPGGRFGAGREGRRGRPGDAPAQSRDRRGGKTARREGGRDESRGRPGAQGRGPGRRFERRYDEAPFEPILQGDFYPDDNAFKALTHAIKHSCRTFELFEIARLILEKPERWVCVAKHPDQKEGEAAILHASVPDGLPFLSEQEALNHVFTHYLDTFFTIEEYEAEPPTGSFQMVHRCGMTGEIIGPPNFHRYQALLRQHHADHLSHLPLEKIQARLESVREQEVIDAWLEKMKKGQRFILKEAPEGEEAPTMPDLEAARLYLLTHAKEKLVRPAYSVRFIGKDLELMPAGHILRRSLEAMYQQQLRFPLETANNLRGRLRRLNLSVYKRGSKGVSYVCAVKRRFREPDEVLAENLSDLISFIEAHQNIKAADLPRHYLGLDEGAGMPATEEAVEPPEASPEAADSTVAPADAGEVAETTTEAPADVAPAASETPQTAQPSKPDESLLALKRDLHYLVSQGYVVEFSDGRLQVPPPREVAKPKPKPEAKKPVAEAPAAPAAPEAPEVPEVPVVPVAPDVPEVPESTEVAPVDAVVAESVEAVSPPVEPMEPSVPTVSPEPPAGPEAVAAPEPAIAPEPDPGPEPEAAPAAAPETPSVPEPTPVAPPQVAEVPPGPAEPVSPEVDETPAEAPSPLEAPEETPKPSKGPTEPGAVKPKGED